MGIFTMKKDLIQMYNKLTNLILFIKIIYQLITSIMKINLRLFLIKIFLLGHHNKHNK